MRRGTFKPTKSPKRKHAASGASAEWPYNDELHKLDLDGVIHYLERTFVENHPQPESARKRLAILRRAAQYTALGYQRTNRDLIEGAADDFPDEPTFSEKLGDLLPVVWADHRWWRLLALQRPDCPVLKDALVANSLLMYYNLTIPFRDSVWIELRARRVQWNYLQILMLQGPARFFHFQAASAKDELTDYERSWLSDLYLGNLLGKYARNPLNDWRPLLGILPFPGPVLRRLQQAAARLAEDAAWCVKHPGRLLGQRAPLTPHRVRSLSQAKAIEDMVLLLRDDAESTDYALAKQCMGRITAAGRKLAKEARQLAHYRDGLTLKSHKSRGDKNAPETSA